ncbi:MAG: DUF2400 family protein [Candidatus Eisenbacteria bacterium]|nr:DUF2400 family protein [Candidatus Eisenbacteria bacterium]
MVVGYADPEDQEIAAFVAAAFAYGRVEGVIASARRILEALGEHPARGLREGRHRAGRFLPGFRHRWNGEEDVRGLCEAAARAWELHGSLGGALLARRRDAADFETALARWVGDLRGFAGEVVPLSRGLRFLLPDPVLGGTCKRWRLFLRWMIRPADGMDLGHWNAMLSPSELLLPLDAHWTRIGPRLGWTRRRTPGRGMAADLTAALRRIAPEDPLRYDFAICHLGITGACPPRLETRHCMACPLSPFCATGRRRLRRAGARLLEPGERVG